MMRKHLSYLKRLLQHKWLVLSLCRKTNCPFLLGLIHDLSKFLPSEWFPYANCFFNKDGFAQYSPTMAFRIAHMKHCHRNPHQYQYWISIKTGEIVPVAIPEKYIREMVADWTAQAIAKGGKSTIPWYEENKTRIVLHEATREKLEEILTTTRW
jgi:hypothetical protein